MSAFMRLRCTINHNKNEKRSHRYHIELGQGMDTNMVNKKVFQHDDAHIY